MLVAMTYNTYLCSAIVVGAFVGHYIYEDELDIRWGGGGGEALTTVLCCPTRLRGGWRVIKVDCIDAAVKRWSSRNSTSSRRSRRRSSRITQYSYVLHRGWVGTIPAL